jgi:general secretion pathway protein D
VISVKNTSVKDVSGALGDLLPPGTIPQDKPPKPEEPTTGLKIRPVPERNALLVRGTRASIDTLKAVIEKLDRFAPQVLIRTLIVEVALDDQTQFGVEGLWESGFRLGGDRKFTTSAGGKFIPGLAGFTYQIAGDGLEAKLLLFAKTGRLDVLATPRVLGVNSREASVSFGKRVPTITNSRITPEGSILNVIEYSDVGISMKVEPRVNADGMVTMPIRVEVSDINQTESVPIGTGTLAPTFTQSRADTTVTVRSGRTVVLGGLIRESLEEATTKIPLLGDVPWIGNVFRGNTTTKQKRELMIFLTPVVVFSQEELDRLTADETGSLKAIDVGRLPLERRRWTGWIRE